MARKKSLDGGPDVSLEIRRAAARLFYERGYGATSVREIADEIDISSSTIYHHFQNKQEVLNAIVSGFMGDFADVIVGPLRESERSPRDRILEAVETHLVFSESRRTELLNWNPFRNHLSAEQLNATQDLRRQYQDAFRDCIEQGRKQGDFNFGDSMLCTMAILDSLNGVREWFNAGGRHTIEEIVREYQTATLRILGADGT